MLNVYIDNSGSMAEMGKLEVAKYIARTLNGKLYTLNGREIQNLNDLKIENIKEINIKDSNILLSDGLIEQDIPKDSFKVALAIGVDSNISVLKTFSEKVFSINEILDFLAFIDSINLSQNTLNDGKDSEWE